MNEIIWEPKCWGEVCHLSDRDVHVSVLRTQSGWRCSQHYHERRYNNFRVITGSITVIEYSMDYLGWSRRLTPIKRTVLTKGQSIDISPRVWHAFEVIESGQVVEIYWTTDGSKVDMLDIVRFDEGGKIDAECAGVYSGDRG